MKLLWQGNSSLYLTVIFIFGCSAAFHVVSRASSQISTQEKTLRWHPRRAADTQFVGDSVCAQCHKKVFASYSQSPMRMAMESVAESRVLLGNQRLTFRNGPYSYEIRRKGQQSIYTVSNGKESLTSPILFAFGQGKAGQTYIVQHNGELYETVVSFYRGIGGLDFTVGASNNIPSSMKEAFGKPLSEQETKNCFGCHTTTSLTAGRVDLENVIAGISCEKCHGPGGRHVEAIQSGEPGKHLIFNPNRLSGDELSQEFCSDCHRPNNDFKRLRSLGVNNVRFQPYRIFHSKCYSNDGRISCIACHNPHEPVKENIAFYDSKCLACHTTQSSAQASVIACKVGTKDCVSCHMQKIEPPQSHSKFTDHYIRIIRSGEVYPN
jgi:Cytochrome c554 and c-prime